MMQSQGVDRVVVKRKRGYGMGKRQSFWTDTAKWGLLWD